MSFHTPEAQQIKKKAIEIMLNQMAENMAQLEAGKKISSSQKPKMYLRMARLLAGTDDSVFIDTVDDLLAKGATGDQIKNKLRNISEKVIPRALKRLDADRLHHGIPLEVLDPLMKQEPEVMLEFLQRGEADGLFFGDSRTNINNSLQEQSHTGAFDRANTVPGELGTPGVRELSAHPSGTNKGLDPALDRIYKSGSEMYEAMLPTIRQAQLELKMGIRSDTPKRLKHNELAIEAGIIKPETDLYSPTTSDEVIKLGRDFAKDRNVAAEIASSHNPLKFQDPKDLKALGYNDPAASIAEWDIANAQRLEKFNGGIRLNRKLATRLAAGGIIAFGPLGTAASAAEVKSRTEIAGETDSLIDKTQAAIAGTGFAADLMTYNPVTAIPGAIVSTGADALNLVIDGGRAFLSGDATRNRRKLERQEQLRAKPADAPERESALSVGFAGGM
mgnify:CR=1 FL=1